MTKAKARDLPRDPLATVDAVAEHLDALAEGLCTEAPGFTCRGEPHRRLIGRDDTATRFLESHSMEDDEGDEHAGLLVQDTPDLSEALRGD